MNLRPISLENPISNANFVLIGDEWVGWDGSTRNLIWNPINLAWEAATGSIAGGLAATINNFPAVYPVTGALTDSELRDSPVEVSLDGGVISTIDLDYTVRIAETEEYTYVGKAVVGALETDSEWQIKRLDESSGLIILFANGNSDFENKWSEYSTLLYS
jgi:hypothetical protein